MAEESTERPKVTLRQGAFIGTTQRGPYPATVDAFLGIPYAQPPTGDRRFRPPVKVGPSSDVFDASKYGPRAPAKQFMIVGPELPESEDCLTVNVFRPKAAAADSAQSLPVAIWVHGGAFNRGNAAMYDSPAVVGWAEAPFVLVTFGYRIGSLGFLPSKLSAEEGALNLGLKDQILLMEWVQENIGEFGGDKNNVTLIGISAGAHSIGHHLLNYDPAVPPLFHRVVMESGAPTSRAVRHYDAEIHEKQFADFLRAVDCPLDATTAPASEVFRFLRGLPTEAIAAAQTKVFYSYNPSLRWAFQPVIDGEIIRTRPIDAWRNGRWHHVPIMTGFNTNEGSIYVNKAMDRSAEFGEFWSTLLPQLSSEDVQTIEKLYPDPETVPGSPYADSTGRDGKEGLGRQYRRIEASYAHYAYVAPARQTVHFTGAEVPTYLYHWALRRTNANGAAHADNMFYEMRDQTRCGASKGQDELSRVLHAYLTSFVCTGDPNGLQAVQRPEWVRHSGTGPQPAFKMIFGGGNMEMVGGEDDGKPAESVPDTWADEESQFWWSKVEISQM